jgi:hypothetical protein
MRPHVALRELLVFLGLATVLLSFNLSVGGLSVGGAVPVAGQDEVGEPSAAPAPTLGPVTPTATLPPGFLPCGGAPPVFALTNNNPHVGEQIGWWASGLQTNTQVNITVRDKLNPNATDAVFRTTAVPNNWCQAMGTLSFSLPIQYEVKLEGVSAMTGQQVSLVSYPFAIPAVLHTPTPIPLQPPAPPTNVRMTQVSRTVVRVDWDDNSSNEDGFVIMTRVGQLQAAANATTMTVGGLENNQVHCFRIYAFNNAGRSLSDVDCMHVRPLPQ